MQPEMSKARRAGKVADKKKAPPKIRPLPRAELLARQAQGRTAFIAVHNVSRETLDGFDVYVDLLNTWQAKMNLVATSTLADVWTRHLADSLMLARLMPEFELNADLGSGGGLPGIVLAIARRESGGRVDLVESNLKKAAFLRAAQRALSLKGTVHADRIENCGALLERADTITARALAPLPDLLDLVGPHITASARCFFHKGRLHEAEMAAASAQWRFSVIQHETEGEDGSAILEIAEVKRLSSAEAI